MSGEKQGFREARDNLERRFREQGVPSTIARERATETARRVDRQRDDGSSRRR